MTAVPDLTLGQYIPGVSPLHRLDPRAKLGACVLVMVAVFLPGGGWPGLVCTLPMLVFGVVMSGVPAGRFARGLRPFVWLFAGIVILHGFTTPGRGLGGVSPGPLWPTVEGLSRGLSVVAQLAAAVGFSALLTLTTDPVDLLWGVERLAAPLERLGLPVGEFCMTVLVALRVFPVLFEEAGRLLTSEGARGSLFHRVRNVPAHLATLFHRTIRRAEDTARSLGSDGAGSVADDHGRGDRRVGGREAVLLAVAILTVAAAVCSGTWEAGF